MSLVNYSSSSSSDSDDNNFSKCTLSKSNKLPLPDNFRNISNKTDKPENNPKYHEGRIRSFEHERGNWATFVFIPVNLNIIEEIQEELLRSPGNTFGLKASEDVHISLTKTVVLRHHWIHPFIESLRSELKVESQFYASLKTLKVYCNAERTRTFIGLAAELPYTSKLEDIMKRLNVILNEYKLEKFYDDPSFHASIVWCLGDHEDSIRSQLKYFQQIVDEFYNKEPHGFLIKVKDIYCKTGNKQFNFNLIKV